MKSKKKRFSFLEGNLIRKTYINLYSNLFKELKYSSVILKYFAKYKFVFSSHEIINLKDILLTTNNISEIKIFLKEIKKFEKLKYKDYKYIDYFFLKKLDYKKNIKYNTAILKDINKNFLTYCNTIEKNNRKKINYIKKHLKEDEFIIGSILYWIVNKVLFHEIKDIDIFSTNQNLSDTKITQKVFYKNEEILIEKFSNKHPFFYDFTIKKEDYYIKDGIKILNRNKKIEFLKLRLNILTRKNIIYLNEFGVNIENDLFYIKNLDIQFPITTSFNKHFKNYITYQDNIDPIEKYNYFFLKIYNKKYSSIILAINYIYNDIEYSLKIHNIIYNEILNDSYYSNLSLENRYLTMLFFNNYVYNIIELKKKDLETKLFILTNLKKIIKKQLFEYSLKIEEILKNIKIKY